MTSTLVLLSYNEYASLSTLIDRIDMTQFDVVFAVDGGSTDGTKQTYEKHGIKVFVQSTGGRGTAFQLAGEHIHTDVAVFFSTDGNEDPADLPRMLAFLEEGYELVVAGRYGYSEAETDDTDDPLRLRKVAGRIGGFIVRLLWNSSVKDPINGYRGFSRSGFERLRLDATGHDIELQSTIRAAKMKLRVKEFPTRELRRIGGDRKSSAGTGTLMWNLGKAILKELYPAPPRDQP